MLAGRRRDNVCGLFVFFFQAEDGIRDLTVTGVQTCALPICGVEVQTMIGDGRVCACSDSRHSRRCGELPYAGMTKACRRIAATLNRSAPEAIPDRKSVV